MAAGWRVPEQPLQGEQSPAGEAAAAAAGGMAGTHPPGHRGLQEGCRLGALVGSHHPHAAPGKRGRSRTVSLLAVMGERVKAATGARRNPDLPPTRCSPWLGIDSESNSSSLGWALRPPTVAVGHGASWVATDLSQVQVPPPLSTRGHGPIVRILHQPSSRMGGTRLLQSLPGVAGASPEPACRVQVASRRHLALRLENQT